LRYLASCAPLDLAVAFPTFAVSTALGFLCTLEVVVSQVNPRSSPSLGFLPSTFLQIQVRFRSGLIGSPKGLRTVTSSALASTKTDARLYVSLRFEV
jgi:hypothetical protein